MANYQFLDAYGSVLTAASSVIGGVNYPIVFTSGSAGASSVSGTVGASIIGLTPVSVTNSPSISGTVGASIIGTVPVVQSGTRITSIIGAYAEDSASTQSDVGVFTLAVRNDTLSSVTSADGDYSAQTVGPAGEVVTANAPLTKWVQGVASCFTGVIQPIIAAQGSSVFTYITSGQITNASANNVYLTFFGATGSVVGYCPVPANSGALPLMPNAWKGNANGAFSASVSGVASVYLSFQGFISKI